MIVRLPSPEDAAKLIRRSILTMSIFEIWGIGTSHESMHASVKTQSAHLWPQYATASFSFTIDSFQGSLPSAQKTALMESFAYLPLTGPIVMKNPAIQLWILEEYSLGSASPKRVAMGRLIAHSGRRTVDKYDLKKRRYISTTSMDSELALITANLALAGPGKLCYDPFTGTGSFPIACAHFGATVLGSDIDGRSIRGKRGRNVVANFEQYNLLPRYLDGFVSDLTNTPLRPSRYLDALVCDPPYGVREGLKVLGSARTDLQAKQPVILSDGVAAHLKPDYIPPKRAYSFEAMMDDILDFGYAMLVDGGRLAMWMPTANDEDIALAIPTHPGLELVAVCVQQFNKWARRLLTYRRVEEGRVDAGAVERRRATREVREGTTADELNQFRRKFFQGFREQDEAAGPATPS